MPLYDYQCVNCKKVTEVRHGFSESFAGACEACRGELKRVFNPAPIVFKGSGFYVTDSRPKSSSSASSTAPAPEKKSDDSSKKSEDFSSASSGESAA